MDKCHQKFISGGGYVQTDLTGGTDSRNVLPLFLMSGVDLENIKFISKNDAYINEWGKGVVTEDFEIASEIAKYYNFSINKKAFPEETRPLPVEEVMNNSFYTKLGFHTPMYLMPDYCLKTVYYFTGGGGEIIRGYGFDWTIEGFVRQANEFKITKLGKSMNDILLRSLDKISKIYGVDRNNLPVLMSRLYRETRTRNHYGGSIVETYLANKIVLAPLMDINLSKIQIFNEKNSDPKLLYALILTRYQKDLLNFKIQGGRFYDKATIELAEQINSKYPLDSAIKKYQRVPVPVTEIKTQVFDSHERINYPEGDAYFLRILNSEKFKSTFTSYFSEEIYYKTKQFSESQLGYPLMPWYPLIAATKILMDVKLSQYLSKYTAEQYWDAENKIQSKQKVESQSNKIALLFSLFQTARIYLVKENMTTIEDFAIAFSDENGKVIPLLNPERNSILGYMLESAKQNINIRFRCKTDGEVSILLNSKEIIGRNNERIPILIDYTNVSVNQNVIFEDQIVVANAHKPHSVKLTVKHDEVYDIVIKWQIHGYTDEEFMKIIKNMIEDKEIYNVMLN